MWKMVRICLLLSAGALSWVGCDDDTTAPPEVTFGETTLVVVVNPIVNDANGVPVATPGNQRSGIEVSVDGGPPVITDALGIAVLDDFDAGVVTVSLASGNLNGEVTVNIADGDLRELAVAFDATGAQVMADVGYGFNGEVIEITPGTPIDQVNEALGQSDVIVFFRGGVYVGDLEFTGSDLTLFGEGERGGNVTLDGNVTVSGSRNRIRGAVITGDLAVPGSGAGVSFGRRRADGAPA